MTADINQLQRTAAEIPDDAIGLVNTRRDAERRQPRLARARENFDSASADAFGFRDEVRAVFFGFDTIIGDDEVRRKKFERTRRVL